MCMEKKGLTKTQFCFDIMAIITKIIKSIGFNAVIFVIGFILGFGTLHLIMHISWTRNQNYECVSNLERQLSEQRDLDGQIDRELTELKLKLIYDSRH